MTISGLDSTAIFGFRSTEMGGVNGGYHTRRWGVCHLLKNGGFDTAIAELDRGFSGEGGRSPVEMGDTALGNGEVGDLRGFFAALAGFSLSKGAGYGVPPCNSRNTHAGGVPGFAIRSCRGSKWTLGVFFFPMTFTRSSLYLKGIFFFKERRIKKGKRAKTSASCPEWRTSGEPDMWGGGGVVFRELPIGGNNPRSKGAG
jgi:hypothetical protein